MTSFITINLTTIAMGACFLLTGQPLYFAATMFGCVLMGVIGTMELRSRVK